MSFINHNAFDKTHKYTYHLEILVKYEGEAPFEIVSESQDRSFTIDEINALLNDNGGTMLDEEYIMVNNNGYMIMDDGEAMIVINEYMMQD